MKNLYVKSGLLLFVSLLICDGLIPTRAFEVKLAGQVNQMIMWADNGKQSDFFVADNDNSSTRFRFTGLEEKVPVAVGFRIEFEAQRNASDRLDLPNTGDGTFEFNDRWLEAHFKGTFGKVSMGKGDGAANNTSEVDLSGTAVIISSAVNDTAGSFSWIDKATNSKLIIGTDSDGNPIYLKIGDTRSNFDGLSRNERLRYDTPKFAGFSLAGSITNGNASEISLWYAGDLRSAGKLAGAVGYVDTRDREPIAFKQLGMSASWLANFGLNLTATYGIRNYEDQTKAERLAAGQTDDAKNFYIKLGFRRGIHAVAVEWGRADDLDLKGDTSSNYGVAYVIRPWQGVELYAAGREYALDRVGVNFENFSQIMAGTRVKF
jgi:hypothetical protein